MRRFTGYILYSMNWGTFSLTMVDAVLLRTLTMQTLPMQTWESKSFEPVDEGSWTLLMSSWQRR
jgi:hypothetical protein